MPSSSSQSENNSTPSPSILNNLSRFTYHKSPRKKIPSSTKNDKPGSAKETPPDKNILVVPETPESELETPGSPVLRVMKKSIPVQISDSEDDCDNHRISPNVENESVSNKTPSRIKRKRNSLNRKRKVLLLQSDDDDEQVRKIPSRRLNISSESDNDSEKSGHCEVSNGTKKSSSAATTSSHRRGIEFISDEDTQDSEPKKSVKVSTPNGRKSSLSDETDEEKETKKLKKDAVCDMSKPVYDSDDSNDDMEETEPRKNVRTYLNTATAEELLYMLGCRTNKSDSLISSRPYGSWADLICKLSIVKYVSTDILNKTQRMLYARSVVNELMHICEKMSKDIEMLVNRLMEGKEDATLTKQPSILQSNMTLASYQMLGLNWLVLMHKQRLNGILADEMGLGKTVQAIAFLAYLLEEKNKGPHLIIVPASTLENWTREFSTWCEHLDVFVYFGSQEERRQMRHELVGHKRKKDYHVVITTYNVVTSNSSDRAMIKAIPFVYVIFDEAHMLKNMTTLRYKNLMKIKAKHRLLLTGTPLQNNLIELMSLLMFVMPNVFEGKTEEVVQMFGTSVKSNEQKTVQTTFEQERIEQAKRIMQPFVLRRLKSNVLKDLPKKHEKIKRCPMLPKQQQLYVDLITTFSKQVKERREKLATTSGSSMMMELRKMANHPLLLRNCYTDKLLKKMAPLMLNEPTHRDANSHLIFEDMQVMSDFELHRLCGMYKSLNTYKLKSKQILDSGKFHYLKPRLKEMKEKGDRILLFSQFTIMLDIIEEFLQVLDYKFIRLDGSTPVTQRQDLIDQFSSDPAIFIFLLSTRAGGLGINLTAANTVILHDIDFNPYNDKQAEDRCHRVGQIREVRITRIVSANSIEEGILQCAAKKLKLEQDISSAENESSNAPSADVVTLLKNALAL
uniref:SWI/SNF-related matrix-associated actin-dependent regulator of chromatin subfamily A containing DEAD/H box 1 homolog n=1 Tax=Strigamia maritima TaxID=126957 RepID=T1J3V7_STRMM